jgi:glycosyltransferase involved in cell wall biosynthesis
MSPNKPWNGLIVICAANSYDATPMADWHMARELSRHTPVLYVDPPVSHLTRFRDPVRAKTAAGLRQVNGNLARLTPLTPPFPNRPSGVVAATAAIRRQMRAATRKLTSSVGAVINGWPQYPIAGACGERVTAYWAKDDFVSGAQLLGMDARMLHRRETKAARGAGLIVASSPAVWASWTHRGYSPVLIPFGTDTALDAKVGNVLPGTGCGGDSSQAGFIGRLNARTDLALLEAVADVVPLQLAGPIDPAFQPARVQALLSRPTVLWHGEVAREDLPGVMEQIGVGLVPYSTRVPFNLGSCPLKTLEYLAAGRAVVSTALPAIRWLGTDLVTMASEPDEFAWAVKELLDGERWREQAHERVEFAAQHSWEHRAGDMLEALESAQSLGW